MLSPSKIVAYERYAAHKKFYPAVNSIMNVVETLGTSEQLDALISLLNQVNLTRIKDLYTFTVCPACYHVLYNRKPTSRFKRFTHHCCALCNTPAEYPGNLHIRFKSTLGETRKLIKVNHPELFV